MSALGQKQTCAAQKVMSALPPKADMCGATRDVRFVPITTGSGAAINWRQSTNSSAMDPRGARAALDARAPAERADGRGEEVARGGFPRGVVRVTRPGACLSPAPPARRRPRGRAAAPPRRRARFGHRAL